ncbi:MAG TPA: hypothetical protein VF322_06880 [Gammaproteobacteria bacterium]
MLIDTLVRSRAGGWARAAVVGVAIAGGVAAFAQEGHPLKGSWLGTWESNEIHGESMFMVLDWDGEKITGMINPGTDNIPIGEASLDPDGWVVRLEADAQDRNGRPVHYVIEGKIQDLELPNRSLVGTWQGGNGRGAFEASRQ